MGLRLWLGRRQIRHVARCCAGPGRLRRTHRLAAHQKAADYSIAKTRLALVDTLIGALLLLP